MSRSLPVFTIRAVNTAPDSENEIHDDRVAAEYGFRGGLVPGVTVYGYMTAPIIEFAPNWLRQGSMQVRFVQPVYDGDLVVVRAELHDDGAIGISAGREDGAICATGTATISPRVEAPPSPYPERTLPRVREEPTRDTLVPGTQLGTVVDKLDSLEPRELLTFSNEVLMQNFKLGPWIHAASDIRNWSAPNVGDEIRASARIHDRFDRKGREFVIVDVMLTSGARLIQTVRHTAIYRLQAAN